MNIAESGSDFDIFSCSKQTNKQTNTHTNKPGCQDAVLGAPPSLRHDGKRAPSAMMRCDGGSSAQPTARAAAPAEADSLVW